MQHAARDEDLSAACESANQERLCVVEIGGGKKRKKKKENEEKASKNATRVELSSKHLCFVFFNPHTICNPCTPTYTYIMYTCTIYSPKTTSGCIHTRLVHENPPTHIHTPSAHTHTHSHYRHHANIHSQLIRSHARILPPTSCFYRGEKGKQKLYFPSTISLFCESPSGLRTQCASFLFAFFFCLLVQPLLGTY